MTYDAVCDHLCARTTRFGPKLISQLDACIVTASARDECREIPLGRLSPGMVLLQELRTAAGQLIVAKGFEVTRNFLDRIANIEPDLLETPVLASRPEPAPKAPGNS
jgi:hypothetical protein